MVLLDSSPMEETSKISRRGSDISLAHSTSA